MKHILTVPWLDYAVGLVIYALRHNNLGFLLTDYQEDTGQEINLFLLTWIKEGGQVSSGPNAKMPDDQVGKFIRAAAHHFYQMARDYGYRASRKYSGYKKEARLGPPREIRDGNFTSSASAEDVEENDRLLMKWEGVF